MRLTHIMSTMLVPATVMAQTYEVVDLGLLGGNFASAHGINDSAEVVGVSSSRGFLWQNGIMTSLGFLPGDSQSHAADISASGEVCGYSGTSVFDRHAFRWSNGVMTELPSLGGPKSEGWGINSLGMVAGYSQNSDNLERAVIWQGSSITDLGTLGGILSFATDISENKTVVGYSTIVGHFERAFIYRLSMESLGTLGGNHSRAWGVNKHDQVVGYSQLSGGNSYYAFLWDDLNGIQQLPSLDGDSLALDINDTGHIVGYSHLSAQLRAAFWNDGIIADLNDLVDSDWRLAEAHAINEAGEIVGRAVNEDSEHRAFLLRLLGLDIGTPSPGIAGVNNTVPLEAGIPGSDVYLVYGFYPGSTSVPGCPNLWLDIADPVIAGSGTVDDQGEMEFTAFVPQEAAGQAVILQAVELGSCRTSEFYLHQF